jgi:GMP synthase (glutamine-hydrolysing)
MPFEDLGAFEPVFAKRGDELRYFDIWTDDFSTLDPLAPDVLVVLGGAVSAYQEGRYPFLIEENVFLERRIGADRPTLGICLGAQLMAKAMGARVYRNAAREVGFAPIALTAAGKASCLSPYEFAPMATHWHGDMFDLPEGVTHLASSALCANQGFSRGPNILALQFHAEEGGPKFERWINDMTSELESAGVDVNGLRRDAEIHGPGIVAKAAPVLNAWLDQLK